MKLAIADSVVRCYGAFTAVDDVDLHVERGEVVGLLGANGAGKTTVVRMLLGLVEPTRGSVLLFGEPPSRATRRRTGYVPQGLGLYDDLTVDENLAFAAAAFGATAHLPDDLAPVRHVLVRDLPLGLRRRVAFAAALQHAPDLLVLDEPTSGVDVLARAALWDTIRSAAERGAGVLVTTHHMDEAEECDRLVMMHAGRVVADGQLHDIARGETAVVHVPDWVRAFDVLEAAGYTVALVGTSLRVPGVPAGDVGTALTRSGLDARVTVAPATLDEVFATIVANAA